MNSVETEYSFLAPTWKLPPIATSSMYPGISGGSYSPTFTAAPPGRNHTMNNSHSIPPNTNRRPQPQTTNKQPGGRPMQFDQQSNGNFDNNDQIDNRKLNYPPPPPPSQSIQKRVQIIDQNHSTPSIDHLSGQESNHSPNNGYHTPEFDQIPQKSKMDDNKSNGSHINMQRSNNFNIYEHLYGLAAPDPGSYVNAYRNQRRRLQDEKLNRKSVMNEYKTFTQNGGFGPPAFGNADNLKYEEKLDTEKKRKTYSQQVREVNQYKVEEQKRVQNNGGQERNRIYGGSGPKHPRPDALRSSFISAQEVREFERRIKREHAANCKCSLHANPHNSSA